MIVIFVSECEKNSLKKTRRLAKTKIKHQQTTSDVCGELRDALCIARFLAHRYAMRYAAFCIARFLARCMFSGHSARPLCLPQVSRRLPPPLAYRGLYEWHGETVRCAVRYALLSVSLGYAALCRFLAPLAACSHISWLLRSGLPTKSPMNGAARPCAALRLSVSLAC